MHLSPGMFIIYETTGGKNECYKILKTSYGTEVGQRDELYLEDGKKIFIEQVIKYKAENGDFVDFPLYKPLKEIPLNKSFRVWLFECKSYKDVDDWFKKYFSFEHSKFKKAWAKEQKGLNFVPARTAEETYRLRTGACQDCVKMIKYCLNKINPSYNTRILTLEVSKTAIHFLPIFDLEDGMYLMEYGSWAYSMHGVWGPFKNFEDIVNDFYLRLHPRHREVEKFYLGWPPLDYFVDGSKEVKQEIECK